MVRKEEDRVGVTAAGGFIRFSHSKQNIVLTALKITDISIT